MHKLVYNFATKSVTLFKISRPIKYIPGLVILSALIICITTRLVTGSQYILFSEDRFLLKNTVLLIRMHGRNNSSYSDTQ